MINLEPSVLLSNIYERQATGYRLVQISCTKLNETLELIYSFDLDYKLMHYKLVVETAPCIPSISSFYEAAALYENEIHDLFGVTFEHMALDYKGNLYKIAAHTPFNPQVANEGE